MTDVIVQRARDQARAQDALLADFRSRASIEVDLGPPGGTAAEIAVIVPAELTHHDGEDAEAYWRRFRTLHAPATGWVRITNPAFDQSASNAMVAAEYACGPRCGWGVLYMISRAADDWRVTDEVILWVQ